MNFTFDGLLPTIVRVKYSRRGRWRSNFPRITGRIQKESRKPALLVLLVVGGVRSSGEFLIVLVTVSPGFFIILLVCNLPQYLICTLFNFIRWLFRHQHRVRPLVKYIFGQGTLPLVNFPSCLLFNRFPQSDLCNRH